MIKNRYIHLIFRVALLGALVYGTVIRFFDENFADPTFYVFYTNLSNMFVALVLLVEIFCTIRMIRKYGSFRVRDAGDAPVWLKYSAMIDIVITFVIYNCFMSDLTTAEYWTDIHSVLFHFAVPIGFVLDWLLFTPHPSLKWWTPLCTLIFPVLYGGMIYLRAYLIAKGTIHSTLKYPYFFMNIETYGVKVAMYLGILFGAVLLASYLIYFIGKIPSLVKRAKKR